MKNQSHAIVGIDISRKNFDIVVLREDKLKYKVFPNTRAGHESLITCTETFRAVVGFPVCGSTNKSEKLFAPTRMFGGEVVSCGAKKWLD